MSNVVNNQLLNNDLYKVLFEENKNIFLLIDDKTGQIVYANKAACEFYQYSFDELINMNIHEINILTPKEVNAKMNKAKLEKRYFFDFKHRLKDGSIKDVEVISKPIKIGEKKYLFSIIHDATEIINQRYMFADIFNYSSDAICLLDQKANIIAVNKSFSKLFGYRSEELLGNRVEDFIFPDTFKTNMDNYISQVLQGKITNVVTERKAKDGRLINVDIIIFPFIIGTKIKGIQVVYRDITDKLKSEHNKKIYEEIIQNYTDGVLILDSQFKIQWVNHSFEKYSGFIFEEVKNKDPEILLSTIHGDEFYKEVWKKIASTGSWQGEIWNVKKDGAVGTKWLNIFTIKDKSNEVKNYICTFKDLTKINSMNKKLFLMLQRDPLTSVYNRKYFLEKLENMISDNQQLYLLFIDLINFNNINVVYDHSIGDEVLIDFSKKILHVFKDNLFARYGGDEFVVVIKDKTNEELKDLIKEFENIINKETSIDGNKIILKCSIGIANYPIDSKNASDLFVSADKAMNYSKTSGNLYTFYEDVKDDNMGGTS